MPTERFLWHKSHKLVALNQISWHIEVRKSQSSWNTEVKTFLELPESRADFESQRQKLAEALLYSIRRGIAWCPTKLSPSHLYNDHSWRTTLCILRRGLHTSYSMLVHDPNDTLSAKCLCIESSPLFRKRERRWEIICTQATRDSDLIYYFKPSTILLQERHQKEHLELDSSPYLQHVRPKPRIPNRRPKEMSASLLQHTYSRMSDLSHSNNLFLRPDQQLRLRCFKLELFSQGKLHSGQPIRITQCSARIPKRLEDQSFEFANIFEEEKILVMKKQTLIERFFYDEMLYFVFEFINLDAILGVFLV